MSNPEYLPDFPIKYDGGAVVSRESLDPQQFDTEDFELSPEDLRAWKSIPEASAEELEAIRNETPKERAAAVRDIFKRALHDVLEESRSLPERIRRAGSSFNN